MHALALLMVSKRSALDYCSTSVKSEKSIKSINIQLPPILSINAIREKFRINLHEKKALKLLDFFDTISN